MARDNFLNMNTNLVKIQQLIIGNENIRKLLTYNDFRPYDNEDVENHRNLIYGNKVNIYPYLNEKKTEKLSFVNIGYRTIEPNYTNNKSRKIQIAFTVLSHYDIWATAYGMRPILLINEIDNIINDTFDLEGIGKVDFQFGSPISFNNTFFGFEITYAIHDFK